MNFFVIVVSTALIVLGALTITRADQVSMAVSKFYSNYPLVRLAGERQMKARKPYMIVVGIVLVTVGVIGLAATMI